MTRQTYQWTDSAGNVQLGWIVEADGWPVGLKNDCLVRHLYEERYEWVDVRRLTAYPSKPIEEPTDAR